MNKNYDLECKEYKKIIIKNKINTNRSKKLLKTNVI